MTNNLQLAKYRMRPFAHQREGIRCVLEHRAFALWFEMGTGKSACIVNAACEMHAAGQATLALVVAPAMVKSVWLDPDLGEIRKHMWRPARVLDFRLVSKGQRWKEIWTDKGQDCLTWAVVSYEFIRRSENLAWLLKTLFDRKDKVLLCFDEASYIANRAADQSGAASKLARSPQIAKVVELTGTPVPNTPLDLWSQLNVLDPEILGARYKNFYHFRARYAIMGGWQMKQVTGYQNLEELQRIIAPHVARVTKEECLDLPPKSFTIREVPLCPKTWAMYKQLKREAIISLGNGDERLEPNAAVRILRLAQLTSGLLGGQLKINLDDPQMPLVETLPPDDVSDEKLKWCREFLLGESTARGTIVWCRFRRERERLAHELRDRKVMPFDVYEIYGEQRKPEREEAKAAFALPLTKNDMRRILIAQPHAGGLGLNLLAATEAIYLSHDWSLYMRLQSEDRCHRVGQRNPVTYIDVIATGPKGERTIDHAIVKALREKEELARWTCAAWRRAIEEE